MYPEYIPHEDEILPTEEQPLPVAASPTADPPGYVLESDPEEEPEEDDEDPEEDPTDYPADRDDDDDDEEEEYNNPRTFIKCKTYFTMITIIRGNFSLYYITCIVNISVCHVTYI
ncbi:hypothetical protein Tco_1341946, partial [Tanacetum coccineum]